MGAGCVSMDLKLYADRYSGMAKYDATYKSVRWVYDDLVNATVSAFVMRHLPDAHDWEGGTYNVTSLDGNDGQAYRAEIDIPTSSYECWLSFEITIPTYETEPMALFIQGIRSGTDGDEETTYVCEGLDGEWKEAEPVE